MLSIYSFEISNSFSFTLFPVYLALTCTSTTASKSRNLSAVHPLHWKLKNQNKSSLTAVHPEDKNE